MRLIFISSVLALTLAACGGDDDGGGDGNGGARGDGAAIVATTPLVADLARNVAGERAEVHSLLPGGADPHDYEPSPGDAERVAGASLVLRSGGELDEWTGELVAAAGGDAPVLDLIDSVERSGDDPHWWHDPRNAVAAVGAIRNALIDADPNGTADYRRNAAAYERRIGEADELAARCLGRVPEERRKLVTTHDALGYLAGRYGIDVVGSVIPSLSTEAQPSAGQTADLVEQIEREDVRVIFAEESVDSKVEAAIARETGAEVGESLFADGLGREDGRGGTYLEAHLANVDALARGFSGGRVSCTEG